MTITVKFYGHMFDSNNEPLGYGGIKKTIKVPKKILKLNDIELIRRYLWVKVIEGLQDKYKNENIYSVSKLTSIYYINGIEYRRFIYIFYKYWLDGFTGNVFL